MADIVRSETRDWVLLRHPEVEGTHRCAPGAVKHWQQRGWKVVAPDAPAAPAKKAPTPAVRPSASGTASHKEG